MTRTIGHPSRLGLSLLALMIGACSQASVEPTPPAAAPTGFDLATARIVDLTYAFDEHTVYWPNSPSTFELEELAYGINQAGFFYAANKYGAPEHGGTHLDAPIHFAADRFTADEVPLEDLIAPAVVIDVVAKAALDPDYRMTRADVEAFEAAHGTIPEGAIVLLHTGWGARWPNRKAFLGDDTPGKTSDLHFPSFGLEGAHYLVENRRVSVLGVDTASIDHGPSTDFPVHRMANALNVAGLENVANLDQVPPTGAWVIALPMKIRGGSGGPARIVALLPGG